MRILKNFIKFLQFGRNGDQKSFRVRRIWIHQNWHRTIFGCSGPHLTKKFGCNARSVIRKYSRNSTSCFSSNFTKGCGIFTEILKYSKIVQNYRAIVRAIFRLLNRICSICTKRRSSRFRDRRIQICRKNWARTIFGCSGHNFCTKFGVIRKLLVVQARRHHHPVSRWILLKDAALLHNSKNVENRVE